MAEFAGFGFMDKSDGSGTLKDVRVEWELVSLIESRSTETE